MTVASSLFFLCFLVTALSAFRRGADVFSPARVFVLVWSFALGATDLKLSYFQNEWSLYSWSLMLLGPLCFLLGVIVVSLTMLRVSVPSLQSNRLAFRRTPLDSRRHLAATSIVFFVYALSFAGSALGSGYIPIFEYAPGVTRTQWGVFGIGLLVHSAPVILYLVTQYFVAPGRTVRRTVIYAFFFAATFGSYVLLIQRYNLALWAVMSFVLLYYASRQIRVRNLLIGGGLLAAAIAVIQTARFAHHVENYIYVFSKMKFSVRYAIITEPYMYLVMGLENFSRGVEILKTHTFGYFTANPLLAVVGLKHSLVSYFNIDEKPFLVSGYNTFPFHWYYYYDFGIPGMVFGSFLMGFAIARAYWKMRSSPDYSTVSVYAICVFIMVISFYLNPLTMLNFLYVIIATLIVQRYVRHGKKPAGQPPQSS